MVLGYEDSGFFGTAFISVKEKHNKHIQEILDYYNKLDEFNPEIMYNYANPVIITKTIRKYDSYIDNNGQKQNKKMSTTEGNFKLVFGRATKTEWSPLLEIYGDSDQEGYFAFSKRYDNRQMGDKIYENNLFFSTQTNKGVVVLLAFDKSEIVLLYDDKVIQYSR